MELETINKLYLELSQITTATTAREILLQKQLTEQSEKQQATMSLAELDMLDYFAAQAIGPLLRQNETCPDENWRTGIAIDAYAMADAMLEARERKPS